MGSVAAPTLAPALPTPTAQVDPAGRCARHNREVDPQHDQDRRAQQHEPEERTGPANGTFIFSLPPRRAPSGLSQGQKFKIRRAEECQPNRE